MDMNEYQKLAMRTANTRSGQLGLSVTALGLCGESGEVADIVKKHIDQGHALNIEKYKEELGDVLWYLAHAAETVGATLDEIAELNIEKLRKRYPTGFSVERSVNREP